MGFATGIVAVILLLFSLMGWEMEFDKECFFIYSVLKLCQKKEKIVADSPVTKIAWGKKWVFGSCPKY